MVSTLRKCLLGCDTLSVFLQELASCIFRVEDTLLWRWRKQIPLKKFLSYYVASHQSYSWSPAWEAEISWSVDYVTKQLAGLIHANSSVPWTKCPGENSVFSAVACSLPNCIVTLNFWIHGFYTVCLYSLIVSYKSLSVGWFCWYYFSAFFFCLSFR